MKVQLVVVQGKPEGMVIPLANARYKIGRGEGCQLRPNSDLVSREHAEFVTGTDSVLVQDLGSRNGTEVNGKKLAPNQPHILKSGDLIKVGTLTFAISIEGLANAKPSTVISGGGSTKKRSLDDVSGDEIDAWLVSDETRPTPDRPSGVYGGDTITLATYNGQEKVKAIADPVKPVAAAPKPVTAAPKPVAPAPTPVPPPAPAPVAAIPVPVAVPEPSVAAAPPAPEPVAAVVPPPTPQPVPPPPVVAEASPAMNPLFDFVPDNVDESVATEQTETESFEQIDEDDGIEDLAALQAADADGDSPEDAMPEEFVDESNPFYVKKKAADAPAAPSKAGNMSGDSSAAAGDILRKLLDRRRASKP